jgi:hypothetical protein
MRQAALGRKKGVDRKGERRETRPTEENEGGLSECCFLSFLLSASLLATGQRPVATLSVTP